MTPAAEHVETVIVGAGQFLVALVFGEVVSQYLVAGGVYPWARRLWGRRWAWMTGWVYILALLVTIVSINLVSDGVTSSAAGTSLTPAGPSSAVSRRRPPRSCGASTSRSSRPTWTPATTSSS